MSSSVTMLFVLLAFVGSLAATSWNYKDEMAQVCSIRFIMILKNIKNKRNTKRRY